MVHKIVFLGLVISVLGGFAPAPEIVSKTLINKSHCASGIQADKANLRMAATCPRGYCAVRIKETATRIIIRCRKC